METIWECTHVDELHCRTGSSGYHPTRWPEDPPLAKPGSRKRSDPLSQMLNGIIFRLRSGCQWNLIAEEELGDDSTMGPIAPFRRWVGTGVMHRMWGALVETVRRVGWRATVGMVARRQTGAPEPIQGGRFGGT